MSDLVLYTNPQPRGHIAHWMMEEIGQPYEMLRPMFTSERKLAGA
jgi:glutathione S-transferase